MFKPAQVGGLLLIAVTAFAPLAHAKGMRATTHDQLLQLHQPGTALRALGEPRAAPARYTEDATPKDFTPPVLTSFAIDTPTVNVRVAPAGPRFSIGISDPDPGMKSASVSFLSPAGHQFDSFIDFI